MTQAEGLKTGHCGIHQYTESLGEMFGNVTRILSIFMEEDEEPKVFWKPMMLPNKECFQKDGRVIYLPLDSRSSPAR